MIGLCITSLLILCASSECLSASGVIVGASNYHSSSVACFWSFLIWIFSILFYVSRSGDSTARIWKVSEGTNRPSSQNGPPNEIVLLHVKAKTNEKSKDVTSVDWNVRILHFLNLLAGWCLMKTSCLFLFPSSPTSSDFWFLWAPKFVPSFSGPRFSCVIASVLCFHV